jgi:hypothetical protein
MVDIFGRAGRILEVEELINRMPMEPDSVIWSTLSETRLAKLTIDKLKKLELDNHQAMNKCRTYIYLVMILIMMA